MTSPHPAEQKLLQLRERFAAALPQRIDDLDGAIRSCEAEPATLHDLERKFHSLAGTAGTYGMNDIAGLAAEGEDACEANAPQLFDHLHGLVDSMRCTISGAKNGPKVFCVDDDPMHVWYLAAILKSAGYEIFTAGDATEFRSLLQAVRPDLIILDYVLPDATGVELARLVRGDPSYATVPIVFLTGRRGIESRIEATNVGVDDFLNKPVDADLLLSVVASRLQRSQSVRALIDRDDLTGVLNRAAFMRRAEAAMAESGRKPESTALVMLDLDHFKSINDRYGHLTGDQVLTTFASFVANSIRPGDEIGRYGGEEFALLLRNIATEDAHNHAAARRIRARGLPRGRSTLRRKAQRARPHRSRIKLTCTHTLDGTILGVNEAAASALAVDARLLIGRNIKEILNPEGGDAFVDYMRRILRDGAAEGTMIVRTRDGQQRTWEYRNVVAGDVIEGVARDITEREEILRALVESEEHFRSIIENVSDVIAVIEPGGVVRFATPSVHILGYAPHELKGRSIYDFIDPSDAPRAAQFFASVGQALSLSGGGEGLPVERQAESLSYTPSEAVELRFCHADGSARLFEVVARNVIRKEQITSIIATARDITDRRKLQTQLQTANRMASLGRLAATVAHEFNNVLMSMQPFAELLQRPKISPDVVLKSAWHIIHLIGRGKRITQDILRFTQPAQPALAPLKVGEWWSTLHPELAGMVADNIELVTALEPDLCIMADASQLAQVFVNLLTNARDAMPRGGTVTITARGDKGRVHFSVADTGCGIPNDMLQQIFEPLFTSKPKGTGLGLAITHQVIQRHNGEIQVESTPGGGTTFHIFLPAAEPATDRQEVVRTRAAIRSRRLLMVEDEPAILEGVVELLRLADLEVSTVTSGEAAVVAVEELEPDVVVLDYGLPGIDGVETCRRIRTRRPYLPVIFSSGHGTQAQLGGDAYDERTRYLQKPFEFAALLDAIATVEAVQ
ncbi:MAG TPA: response regulator [Thermoanaerobaculia bacterium]|nr:response regulator [Thermoanaerobaculia bacterium]